jgi:hypothetical protein
MSVVRPEFGPTLPELLGPRLRGLGRRGRIALGVAAGLLVLAVTGLLALRDGDGRTTVVVREPIAFNLLVPASLQRVAPAGDEVLRLQSPRGTEAPQRLTATPLRLAPYRGDAGATLAILTVRLIDEMRAELPGFVHRGDGRARVNQAPGYQIAYQARIGGRTTYGRRVLVLPEAEDGQPLPREGLDLDLRAARSLAVPNVDAVGRNGALKLPLASFRFGTDRP